MYTPKTAQKMYTPTNGKDKKATPRDLLYRQRKCAWQGIYGEDVKHGTFSCLIHLDLGVMDTCYFKGDETLCNKPGKRLI